MDSCTAIEKEDRGIGFWVVVLCVRTLMIAPKRLKEYERTSPVTNSADCLQPLNDALLGVPNLRVPQEYTFRKFWICESPRSCCEASRPRPSSSIPLRDKSSPSQILPCFPQSTTPASPEKGLHDYDSRMPHGFPGDCWVLTV